MKRICGAICGLAALALGGGASAATAHDYWLQAWSATFQHADGPRPPAPISGQTVNAPLTISIGGVGARVRLSNELSAEPVTIGAASLILPDGQVLPLKFGGLSSVRIPAGAPMLSDPVHAKFTALETLTVSVYLPGAVAPGTLERQAKPTAFVTDPGDFTAKPGVQGAPYPNILVSGVEVASPVRRPVVVIFGDTKAAGPGTWPEFFAPRTASAGIATANSSMFAGLLALGAHDQSGLARFDRDVLTAAGATSVIIQTGNNDIIQPGMVGSNGKAMMDASVAMSVDEIIADYRQLIDRAHAHGLKVIGTTLLPYAGVTIPGYSAPEKLAKRDAINAWIRHGGAFDAVIDFDAMLRDPADPQRLPPAYDSGNHFTPNAEGFKLMARSVDLKLFR